MDTLALQKRYSNLTKRYLLLTGICPNQKKSTQYFSRFMIYGILVPCFIGLTSRLVCFFSLTTVLQQMCFILAIILVCVKHGNYIVNDAKLEALMKGMMDDWEQDRTEEEIAIMISYMDRAALFALAYVVLSATCAILFVQMPWWPRIADILMPLNESRPRGYIFEVYYFVESDNYYYWIVAQSTMATCTCMCCFVSCDLYFIYGVQHACGLFAVTGHRFKRSIDNVSDASKIEEMSKETYRKICQSIKAHDRAIKYVRDFDNLHYGYLLICMAVIVVGFSITLVAISRMTFSSEYCQYCSFLMVQLMHTFFLTLQGQVVINSVDDVYNAIYEGLWYNTMPKAQALFILALRSSIVTPQITAGGCIPMNLQTFADVIKASVSYFTVFQSM